MTRGPGRPLGPPAFVLGVDGGGSRSRGFALDLQGREIGRAQGPPALVDPSNPGRAAEAVAVTARLTMDAAGVGGPARFLWTGLAGAGPPGAREAVEITLRSMGLAQEVRVGMDVEGAHRDAFGAGPGVLLVVGTGSMAWGRDPQGHAVRVGGWGSLLGDEGSGYWFGLEGLRAVIRAFDGRGPATRLTQTLLPALHLPEPGALPVWIAGASKGDVASLAPRVLELALEGDTTARAILSRGLGALGRYLEVVAKVWEPWGLPFPLGLSGGLVVGGGCLREPLSRIAVEWGGSLISAVVDPARGAATIALDLVAPGDLLPPSP